MNALIAKWNRISLSDAIEIKNIQLSIFDNQLIIFYKNHSSLNEIIEYFHTLLWKSICMYSDSELWTSNWKSLRNYKTALNSFFGVGWAILSNVGIFLSWTYTGLVITKDYFMEEYTKGTLTIMEKFANEIFNEYVIKQIKK
ncbi:hypothetical protein [Spiroplasma endosymbiont of Labia minor]|uniref:hypothetical protein n=1 Tax=Spiroplasma endosymbiont of Labia minor TaxID=3066305 RepID=UPI0030CDA0A9